MSNFLSVSSRSKKYVIFLKASTSCQLHSSSTANCSGVAHVRHVCIRHKVELWQAISLSIIYLPSGNSLHIFSKDSLVLFVIVAT